MTKTRRKRLLLAAVVALIAWPVFAAGPGADLAVPPYQVFQAMLSYAREGRFEHVDRVLDRSGALISALEAFSGQALEKPLRAAIDARKVSVVENGVLRLVYQHMRQELPHSVRLAYLDFLFLKSRLEDRSSRDTAEVEELFRELYEGHASESETERRVARIELLCGAIFEEE